MLDTEATTELTSDDAGCDCGMDWRVLSLSGMAVAFLACLLLFVESSFGQQTEALPSGKTQGEKVPSVVQDTATADSPDPQPARSNTNRDEETAGSEKNNGAAARSVVSTLLNFTLVDNLLEAATRAPSELSNEDSKSESSPMAKAAGWVEPVRRHFTDARALSPAATGENQEATQVDDEVDTTERPEETESGKSEAGEPTRSSSSTSTEESSGKPTGKQDKISGSDSPADAEVSASQRRAVRSVRMLVVAIGIIGVVGVVRLLMHLNQLAHGNYAGRLQFIGWIAVSVILVGCLALSLNDQLWEIAGQEVMSGSDPAGDTLTQ